MTDPTCLYHNHLVCLGRPVVHTHRQPAIIILRSSQALQMTYAGFSECSRVLAVLSPMDSGGR